MDAKALAEAMARARTIEHTIGSRTFHLTEPDDWTMRRLGASARDAVGGDDALSSQRYAHFEHLLAIQSITGWEGVTSADFEIPGDPVPIDFSPKAAALLVDSHVEWQDAICRRVMQSRADRRAAAETDRKN